MAILGAMFASSQGMIGKLSRMEDDGCDKSIEEGDLERHGDGACLYH